MAERKAVTKQMARRYQKAPRGQLEAGTDPAVVARWISEVQAERKSVEQELRRHLSAAALTEDDIRAMVESLGDVIGVSEAANPQKKAELYDSLGLSLTYEPSKRRVLVEADLGGVRTVRVGGPKSMDYHPEWRVRPWPPGK